MQRFKAVILAGLLLVVTFAVAILGVKWVRSQRGLHEQLTARDVVYEQVREIVLNESVLKMAARFGSAAGNAELAHCVLGQTVAPGPCTVTDAAKQVEFSVPENREPSARLISGDEATPGIYGALGSVGCESGEANCPGWEVVSSFWAECPDHAPECDVASAINVRIRVYGVGKLVELPSVPAEQAFEADPAAFAVRVALHEGGMP